MKPTKYSLSQANTIDLGTKVIYKYPMPTKLFDVGRRVINGRHPEDSKTYIVENEYSFIMYVTKGIGRVFANEITFDVESEDVVFMPAKTKFAVQGQFEYITFDSPAFYLE
jgi:mannose-6-phosphate isomerase class I